MYYYHVQILIAVGTFVQQTCILKKTTKKTKQKQEAVKFVLHKVFLTLSMFQAAETMNINQTNKLAFGFSIHLFHFM